MKILIVEGEASNSLGGAELSMFSYIKHLKASGHQVFLSYEQSGDWLSEDNSYLFEATKRICMQSLTSVGLSVFVKNILAYIKFVRTHHIDVMFTHTIHGFLFLRIANQFLKLKTVVYFKWIYSKPTIGFLNTWGLKGISKAAFLPSVKDYWIKAGLPSKVVSASFYDGIERTPHLEVNTNPVERIRNLVYFGRITRGKGVHLIIQALLDYEQFKLDIYGRLDDTAYVKDLKSMIKNLNLEDRIRLMGFTPSPMHQIIKYDLVIVPTLVFEPQCRVLFEAMQSSTLVIASNSGGMPKILGRYKEKLAFEPNIDSLRLKLAEMQSLDSKEVNAIKAYYSDRFNKRYSEERTHEKLDQLLFNPM